MLFRSGSKKSIDSDIDSIMATDEIKTMISEMKNLVTINPGEDNRTKDNTGVYKFLKTN